MSDAGPQPQPQPQHRDGVVQAVCLTHAVLPDAGRVGRTGIDKRPVDVVELGAGGLAGDVVCDEKDHGGRDKAVYAYSAEDAAWWERELGRTTPPGWFGENLRLSGVAVSGAVVGERWRVGAAVLEVTEPRTPCATFARHVGEPRWVKRFTEAGRTGTYLRVLSPGAVRGGDPVVVEHVPDHGVTVRRWFTGRDPQDARTLLGAGLDLSTSLRGHLERSLRRA